jgi:Na+-translocating ferredoxin:NAD+ oxidoreductase subunit B
MIGLLIILGIGFIILYLNFKTDFSNSSNNENTLSLQTIDSIESLLPQTQCGQCHFTGCRPYAEAIALGKADIDQCPPGGELTRTALARLLGKDLKFFSGKIEKELIQSVALIDEDLCIGCVKCIKACPVDAIMGAQKYMHTVIKKYCTGCELCIPSCPVDCISMVPLRVKTKEWIWSKPDPNNQFVP